MEYKLHTSVKPVCVVTRDTWSSASITSHSLHLQKATSPRTEQDWVTWVTWCEQTAGTQQVKVKLLWETTLSSACSECVSPIITLPLFLWQEVGPHSKAPPPLFEWYMRRLKVCCVYVWFPWKRSPITDLQKWLLTPSWESKRSLWATIWLNPSSLLFIAGCVTMSYPAPFKLIRQRTLCSYFITAGCEWNNLLCESVKVDRSVKTH